MNCKQRTQSERAGGQVGRHSGTQASKQWQVLRSIFGEDQRCSFLPSVLPVRSFHAYHAVFARLPHYYSVLTFSILPACGSFPTDIFRHGCPELTLLLPLPHLIVRLVQIYMMNLHHACAYH